MTSGRIILVTLCCVFLSACGGSKGVGGPKHGTIRGEIVREGISPSSVVLIRATDGRLYLVQSSVMGDELRNLTGMSVEVSGPVVSELEGVPVIDVRWYELLPLSSGERPVVGWIRSGGFIITDNDIVYKLGGDFEDLLATFVGAKVWVVGIVQERVNTGAGSYRLLAVTDYGVIR